MQKILSILVFSLFSFVCCAQKKEDYSNKMQSVKIGDTAYLVTHFYPSGQKEVEFYKNAKSQRHGKYYMYNELGVIHTDLNYLNGQLHGEQIFYWENGNKKLVEHYAKGKLHGKRSSYTFEGKLISEENYKGGKKVK
jgi:antitoxin component YwqK of YwqJK toxin-antitoxin module